jgi:hypothetical protein
MQRGIFRSFGLLIGAMLCVFASVLPGAEETTPMQPGIITSFAPVVEKVAPSVVCVHYPDGVTNGGAVSVFR